MVRVSYASRIICDSSFIAWALKHQNKATIFNKLMHIKSSSKSYEGEHNVILDFDVKEAKALTKEYLLRGAFKEVTTPDFIDGHTDPITKRIRYAIWMANKPPYSSIIFTAPENKSKYEQNPHLRGMLSVRVMTADEATGLLDTFWNEYKYSRLVEGHVF